MNSRPLTGRAFDLRLRNYVADLRASRLGDFGGGLDGHFLVDVADESVKFSVRPGRPQRDFFFFGLNLPTER